MSKDKPKEPGPRKCRRCNGALGSEPRVRRGGNDYHDREECLSRAPRPHRHRPCRCEMCEGACSVCGGVPAARATA